MCVQDEAEADGLRPGDDPHQEWRGDAEGEEGQEEEEGLQPQRIWVLCGGGGSKADASLASGISVYHELLKHTDVLVRSTADKTD